jgi:hypothetical protein
MFRVSLPVAVVVGLCRSAIAEEVPVCDPSTMDCSPVVVCVEATGEVFRGASFGRDSGTFAALSVSGVVCKGTWRRTFMGLGLAEFTCADGRSGTSAYTWFEPETGTAVGSGRFSHGEEASFWAGNNLERYFRELAPGDRKRMACQPEDMLVS